MPVYLNLMAVTFNRSWSSSIDEYFHPTKYEMYLHILTQPNQSRIDGYSFTLYYPAARYGQIYDAKCTDKLTPTYVNTVNDMLACGTILPPLAIQIKL